MTGFFNYEVSPPLAYIVGICLFLNATLIASKAYMQSMPKYGFRQRGWVVTVTMYIVAVWMLNRSLVTLQAKTVNVNVIFLGLSVLAWRLSDMREYVQRSRKSYAVQKRLDEAAKQSLPTHEFGVA